MVPLMALDNQVAFNVAWFTPLFLTAAAMLVLIRRAASGTDETIRRRLVLSQRIMHNK